MGPLVTLNVMPCLRPEIMILYYHFHDTNKQDKDFVVKTLTDLHTYLRSPELNIDIILRELTEKIALQVSNILKNNNDIFLQINSICQLRKSRRNESEYKGSDPLLIGANPIGEIARKFKEVAPYALYGVQFPNTNIAAIYHYNDPYTTWHEIFHLLGSEDCYEVNDQGEVTDRGPTCGMTNCIMQYGITAELIGQWPFLCDKNIKRTIMNVQSSHGP